MTIIAVLFMVGGMVVAIELYSRCRKITPGWVMLLTIIGTLAAQNNVLVVTALALVAILVLVWRGSPLDFGLALKKGNVRKHK